MTKKKTTKKPVKIKATLKLLAHYYEAEGKTVEEALNKINPPVAKTVGVLTLEKGKLKREKILQQHTVSGAFGKFGPTRKTIAMKHLKAIFSDFDD